MAKFIFSMQNLLKIREQLENQSKMEYAAAQSVLREQEQKLEELHDRKAAYFEKGRQMRQTTLNVVDLANNTKSLELMDDLIGYQRVRVEHAKDDVEDAREALTKAMQERKTLESLREKAFENFLEEEKIKENKEVDELVSYTYGRRIKENADGGES